MFRTGNWFGNVVVLEEVDCALDGTINCFAGLDGFPGEFVESGWWYIRKRSHCFVVCRECNDCEDNGL